LDRRIALFAQWVTFVLNKDSSFLSLALQDLLAKKDLSTLTHLVKQDQSALDSSSPAQILKNDLARNFLTSSTLGGIAQEE
jgi:hypothetical protein